MKEPTQCEGWEGWGGSNKMKSNPVIGGRSTLIIKEKSQQCLMKQ